MRSKKQTFVYEHPFEVLVEAYNRRFPTSPRIPILLSSTVVAERTQEDGVRYLKRECVMDVEAPM